MTDVFVSYKREDRVRVEALTDALQQSGLTTWWDQAIPGAARWRETIAEHLDRAKCVIVCWSEAAVGPEGSYVREEAERAKQRGVLLPVLLDPVTPPFGFGEIQALDLVGWRGDVQDARLQSVLDAVRAVVSGEVRPPPKRPRRRRQLIASASTALIVVAGVTGFLADVAGLQNALCKVPGVHGVCAAYGLGNTPTDAEAAAWDRAQATNSRDGFRGYLREYPAGVFAEQANSRLAACRDLTKESWRKEDRRLPLYVTREGPPSRNKDEAQAAARERASAQSENLCKGFGQSDLHRLVSSDSSVSEWQCEKEGAGWICGFNGQAVCTLEVRVRESVEDCR